MQETIEQFKNLSRKDQKEVLNLIKLKNDFKKQETKRKVKKYDEILEHLKKQISFLESYENSDDSALSWSALERIQVYREILSKLEEGKK